jgi:hypothetical protein
MKRIWLAVLTGIIFPVLTHADETNILYHELKIAGPQIYKDYYVKESIKKPNPGNPDILQIDTHSTVTSPEGMTIYRDTYHINCNTRKFTTVKHWSSGFGYDNGSIVNGKWSDVSDYEEILALTNAICPVK